LPVYSKPQTFGAGIKDDYDQLKFGPGGYDHNYVLKNFLEGKQPRDVGKGGRVYAFRTGFCLEADHLPIRPTSPTSPPPL
jgi:hypothetical protein